MQKYILVLCIIGALVLFLLKHIYRYIKIYKSVPNEHNYAENLKSINENESNLYKELNGVLEYSREQSKELGFEQIGWKRPSTLKRKGDSQRTVQQKEMAKIKNKAYVKAIKNRIPLEYLYTKEVLKDKTLRVYVESINGSKAVLRDNSAIKEIDLIKIYDVAGHFTLINIDKDRDVISVNYVLTDD